MSEMLHYYVTTSFGNYEQKEAVQSNQSFTDFIFSHLSDKRSGMRPDTYFTYKSVATKLLRFRPNIQFSDITERFISDYREWMLKIGNNENTTSKSLRTLRTWVNQALRHGHMQKNPFQYYRIKKVDGKREFLKIDEFNVLFDKYQSCAYSGMKADILENFLFSCTTGLRYSDMRRLKWEDIVDDMIILNMHKTSLSVSIPISDKAKQILKTCANDRQLVFKTYCNKVTNRLLKEIIKDCGITKKITFHVARHSFATISITLGIPIEVVSKLLGHTDLKTTQIYAKVVDSVKIREMTKWNSL